MWNSIVSVPDHCLCFYFSRALKSKVNSPMWSDFELIRYFMSVQVICKLHKDPIKIKHAALRTTSNMVFSALKGK